MKSFVHSNTIEKNSNYPSFFRSRLVRSLKHIQTAWNFPMKPEKSQ